MAASFCGILGDMNVLDVNFLRNEKALFVTGTDTGIGKTHVSCALLQALRGAGLTVQGMKPVASGCVWVEGAWQNDDALALQQAAASEQPYALINPYALPLATAPQVAAAKSGTELALEPMTEAFRTLSAHADTVLVEGVGGWLAPLSDTLDQADLVHALDIPVLLVVGMRLGCINHARLSALAIEASGCRLLGWVGNNVEPDFDAEGDYFAALQRVMPSPCLGVVAYGNDL